MNFDTFIENFTNKNWKEITEELDPELGYRIKTINKLGKTKFKEFVKEVSSEVLEEYMGDYFCDRFDDKCQELGYAPSYLEE